MWNKSRPNNYDELLSKYKKEKTITPNNLDNNSAAAKELNDNALAYYKKGLQ